MTSTDAALARSDAPLSHLAASCESVDLAWLSGDPGASDALSCIAAVLRHQADALAARPLPATVRRLADLDAALLRQIADNCELEYRRTA